MANPDCDWNTLLVEDFGARSVEIFVNAGVTAPIPSTAVCNSEWREIRAQLLCFAFENRSVAILQWDLPDRLLHQLGRGVVLRGPDGKSYRILLEEVCPCHLLREIAASFWMDFDDYLLVAVDKIEPEKLWKIFDLVTAARDEVAEASGVEALLAPGDKYGYLIRWLNPPSMDALIGFCLELCRRMNWSLIVRGHAMHTRRQE